ncbi:MAG: EAL domain-containing protein [Campylobacterota bacterium]|nr:EAL domain-containing protein [Campylobacterota bacterium]
MKSFNTYYRDKQTLISFIDKNKIENDVSLLIQIFSSFTDKSFIETLLLEVSALLPDAVIIGSTTDGEIMDGRVTSAEVVLSFTQFEHTVLKCAAIEHKDNGYYSGEYLAKVLLKEETKLLIVFADGIHTNGEELLEGIVSINDDVIIAGGHAADNSQFKETLVFTKEKIVSRGAVAVSLSSKQLHIHTDYSFNWYPIGNELTITKAVDNRLYTIDGKSAVDIYAYYLGENIANGLPAIGIEFPLIINRNGSDISRAAIAKKDDGSLIMGGNLYTGEKVRIGYGNSKEILQNAHKIVENTSKKPSEAIFLYSCTTRKYFMGDEIESETLPLQSIAPVSGFFTYGEFFSTPRKELLNQTMTLLSLSETDTIETLLSEDKEVEEEDNATINGLIHLLDVTTKETQKHHERMRLAISGTNEGVWEWNILDNSVYFSPRWKEILGYRDEELSNTLSTWSNRLHPDDKERTWGDVYKNVHGETKFYENIHRLKHKAGHWVWILDRGRTQYDENGQAIRMIGTHLDITHEVNEQNIRTHQIEINSSSISGLTHLINITSEKVKEQTQTIIESDKKNKKLKERMELALLGSNTSVLDWSFKDNHFYISPSWKEMLGYEDDELPNAVATWKNRVHPEDLKNVLYQLQESWKHQAAHFNNTHRLLHKDGRWIWVLGRSQVYYDAEGNKVRMVGTQTDITVEKELQLKYSHYAQMIAQTHESVYTMDLNGRVTSWNRGAERLFGYSAEEMIGQSIALLHKKEAFEDSLVAKVLIEEGEYRHVLTLIKKSGQKLHVNLSLSLLRDDNGLPMEIVGYGQDVTEQKNAEDELNEQKDILRYQAHHDSLTDLPNRTFFTEKLKYTIQAAKDQKKSFALFFIDLDRFKDINDSLGHDIGDKVLKAVAKRLTGIIRSEDTLARLSGDEFTLIMGDLQDPEDASILARKILSELSDPIYIRGNILYVKGSIGISLYPQDAKGAKFLLKYADTAMYKAKEEGRNNFQFYASEMTVYALEHLRMKTSLQQAIEMNEFVVYYQPQIDIQSNTIVGLEALVRWEHKEKGLLLPDTFIPLAEEIGLIVKIDQFVIKTAMQELAKWYQEGLNPGVLAVNISINQLECNDFIENIKKCLKKNGLYPECLELEITESQMIKKPEEIIEKLTQIDDYGIKISIDDFGTGYSSLSLLKRLPIHKLKIDKSFVEDIPDDEEDVEIVKTIITLAKSLKLELIAEGVETSNQKEFLIKNGCKYIQGYLYSPPLSAGDMHQLLMKQ